MKIPILNFTVVSQQYRIVTPICSLQGERSDNDTESLFFVLLEFLNNSIINLLINNLGQNILTVQESTECVNIYCEIVHNKLLMKI